jgi:endo-1,3-1,4-beta-glycanase ExoK
MMESPPFARRARHSLALALLATACGADGTMPRQPAESVSPVQNGAAPATTGDSSSANPGSPPSVPGEVLPSLPASGSSASPGSSANPSSSATADPPAAESGPFVLAWQDDFDTLDDARWQLMTHSWDTNLAQFSTENARVVDGTLQLMLTAAAGDTVKPFRGVELRSRDTLVYGKVEARLRFARGSGVVSSLVLIYTPWPADDWNELDIEFLGRYADRVQFNAMVYTGPPTQAPVTQSVTPTQFPQLVNLAFDPAQDFHVFAIEWTPEGARFTIDGSVQHTWASEIDRLKLPQNILLTIWASSSPEWAGAIAAETAPVSAEYDWIRVYDYSP